MSVQTIINHWKHQPTQNTTQLKAAIAQVHRGVQFIAMFGKHYLPHQADDSHTNMEWLENSNAMAGGCCATHKGKVRWVMDVAAFSLQLQDTEGKNLATYALHGKTKAQALDWFKAQLEPLGLEAENMQMDLHYDIPEHETDQGVPFNLFDQALFKRVAHHYANADLVLRHYAKDFLKNASEVRIWPHHFDIGTYIPMVFDEVGNAQRSFSLGYAIPDGVVDDFYFYITQWSETNTLDYEGIEPLPVGQWLPEQLHGAALAAEEIASSDTAAAQMQKVSDYMEAGIKTALRLIEVEK